jgi:hypothetical protein
MRSPIRETDGSVVDDWEKGVNYRSSSKAGGDRTHDLGIVRGAPYVPVTKVRLIPVETDAMYLVQ